MELRSNFNILFLLFLKMSDDSRENAEIEIENEDDEEEEPKSSSKSKSKPSKSKQQPERLTITRKKVSELTEAERNQLIADAQQGIDNDFFSVKLFKNGATRICLRKQTRAQQVLTESNDNTNNQSLNSVPTTIRRYYTDQQLLLEHVINLETSFNALKAKHKKLKKRYNELEGYLYNDDESSLKQDVLKEVNKEEPPKEQVEEQSKQQQVEQQPIEQEQQPVEQIPQQQQVRRRYIRSWRDLGNQQ